MQARPIPQYSLVCFELPRSVQRRACALLLALAIGLASFMHVAHSHDANAPIQTKQTLCNFCTVFDRSGGAPPPATPALLTLTATTTAYAAGLLDAPASTAARTPCNPRAPPAFQA